MRSPTPTRGSLWSCYALLLGCVGLVACGPPQPDLNLPPREEPERCVLPDPNDDPPPDRAIALGEGTPAGFAAYEEGDTVPLILGWQGGYMITPRVRVEAHPEDGDESCWQVHLQNAMPGYDVAPGLLSQLVFSRHDDAFYSDPLNNLLSYDEQAIDGQLLQLDVTVRGIGVDAAAEVDVMLAAGSSGG